MRRLGHILLTQHILPIHTSAARGVRRRLDGITRPGDRIARASLELPQLSGHGTVLDVLVTRLLVGVGVGSADGVVGPVAGVETALLAEGDLVGLVEGETARGAVAVRVGGTARRVGACDDPLVLVVRTVSQLVSVLAMYRG